MKKEIISHFAVLAVKFFIFLGCLSCLQGCGIYLNPPGGMDNTSHIGELTYSEKNFKKLPPPAEPIIVGVYKFRDQTGQYKESENMANWSTAIPQGLTSILIKSLSDSKWFVPIERENIGNLLNERQIIRTTREEYSESNTTTRLPPLLFAGTLIEGGVVSYDSNIQTGGAGARYFGIGGSTQYRQDRITVYLRAVSTNNGKILKTIYTSKTILSQSINASMFRYVDPDRLMEAEVGVTNNEPVHMAVTEAINKAVYLLILEGIQDNIWQMNADTEDSVVKELLQQYQTELEESTKRVPGKGSREANRRTKASMGLAYTLNTLRGDYKTPNPLSGAQANFKFLFSDYINVNLAAGYQKLGSEIFYLSEFFHYDLDMEYIALPYNDFTPYLTAGFGAINDIIGEDRATKFKTQIGGGLEYKISPVVGLRGFGKYHIGFDDDWDGLVQGKRNDHFLQLGIGLQIYIGNTKKQQQ